MISACGHGFRNSLLYNTTSSILKSILEMLGQNIFSQQLLKLIFLYVPLDSSRLRRWWWYWDSQSPLFWLWQQGQPLADLIITDDQCHYCNNGCRLQYLFTDVWIWETSLTRGAWCRATSLWLRRPTAAYFNITVSLTSTQWRREGKEHHRPKAWLDGTGTTGCHGG